MSKEIICTGVLTTDTCQIVRSEKVALQTCIDERSFNKQKRDSISQRSRNFINAKSRVHYPRELTADVRTNAFTLAPHLINNWHMGKSPRLAAKCNGVRSSPLGIFTFFGYNSNMYWTTSNHWRQSSVVRIEWKAINCLPYQNIPPVNWRYPPFLAGVSPTRVHWQLRVRDNRHVYSWSKHRHSNESNVSEHRDCLSVLHNGWDWINARNQCAYSPVLDLRSSTVILMIGIGMQIEKDLTGIGMLKSHGVE